MSFVQPSRSTYSISTLAARFGLSLRTLRFYEERGLIAPQHVYNRRYYGDRDVVCLQVIVLAKRLGFTINEIKELIDKRKSIAACPTDPCDLGLGREEIKMRIEMLTERRRDIDAAIAELSSAMLVEA